METREEGMEIDGRRMVQGATIEPTFICRKKKRIQHEYELHNKFGKKDLW
jgi:hypothetical protein